MKKFLIIPALLIGLGLLAAETNLPTTYSDTNDIKIIGLKAQEIREIQQMPFDEAFQKWLKVVESNAEFHAQINKLNEEMRSGLLKTNLDGKYVFSIQWNGITNTIFVDKPVVSGGGPLDTASFTDIHTEVFTPSRSEALTCRLGQIAHLHESFLISALNTNADVSMILDSSHMLCSKYGVNSWAMVEFDPTYGYSTIMRGLISGSDEHRKVWLDAIKKAKSGANSQAADK